MEFFAFEWVTNPQIWLSLVTLSALEIVLGIDNLVFLAILTNRLPPAQRPMGRKIGLALALGTRLLLLASLAWIVKLTEPIITLFDQGFSWRDMILIGGGLFLMVKAIHEIHGTVEGEADADDAATGAVTTAAKVYPAFTAIVVQIALVDIIFSLDSVITAVGMVDTLWVMVLAVVFAMIIMLVASGPLAAFVSEHPTIKMLALSFLLLIGVFLIADGFGLHIPKSYLYFALGFSVLIEGLNHWMRKKAGPGRRAA